MRLLLDTHAFLWTWGRSDRLPSNAKRAIEDPQNDLFLSAVSLWEIAIKTRSGRLHLDAHSPLDLLRDADSMNIQLISVDPIEAASHADLQEGTHFDPFDRMLIWQAITRKLTLVSGDKEFRRFEKDGLKLLWN
jgi:PIN domain nuclease of toxin-antitoxin system